jgi:translation initiation factor IF-2
MKHLFSCGIVAAALLVATTPASASELSLTISNGRVTLVAQDVTVRQILAEWARVGQTKIINGEKMLGGPVTIELRDVPEAKALETLLRSAAGYVIAPRAAGSIGPSAYDAVVILATSRAPVVTASAPPTFRPPPQPIVPPINEEPADPTNANEQPVPGATSPFPGPATRPGLQPPPGQQPPGSLTSPVPGQLPPPPVAPGNPYQPQPGARPAPGVPRPGGGGGGQ